MGAVVVPEEVPGRRGRAGEVGLGGAMVVDAGSVGGIPRPML